MTTNNNENGGQFSVTCCTLGYKQVTVMDFIKFELNNVISLNKKTVFSEDAHYTESYTKNQNRFYR